MKKLLVLVLVSCFAVSAIGVTTQIDLVRGDGAYLQEMYAVRGDEFLYRTLSMHLQNSMEDAGLTPASEYSVGPVRRDIIIGADQEILKAMVNIDSDATDTTETFKGPTLRDSKLLTSFTANAADQSDLQKISDWQADIFGTASADYGAAVFSPFVPAETPPYMGIQTFDITNLVQD